MHDVLLIFWQCRNLSVAPAKIDIAVEVEVRISIVLTVFFPK